MRAESHALATTDPGADGTCGRRATTIAGVCETGADLIVPLIR